MSLPAPRSGARAPACPRPPPLLTLPGLQRCRRCRRPDRVARAGCGAGASTGQRLSRRAGRRPGRAVQGERASPRLARTLRSLCCRPALQVCEEIPSNLDLDVAGLPARPAALLLPRLLSLFSRRAACSRAAASTQALTIASPVRFRAPRSRPWVGEPRSQRAPVPPASHSPFQCEPAGGLHACCARE